MSAKWLLFSQSFLFTVLMHFLAFATLAHMTALQNNTNGDRLALLAIKSMIKDDPKGVMASWNHSTTNFCQWQGVTCSARHQRVTILDLLSGGLIGPLSPSIGNLSFLSVIWLSYNSFSGEIPPEIGRLFRLRELHLDNNLFTGNIPATIMNCSNIQFIDLGSNNLTGKIPDGIGSLSMLLKLVLDKNILQGGITPFIGNLTLLEWLSLDDCQLGGSLPDIFQPPTKLRILSMPGNNLIGTIPPSLYNCSSLEYVFLSNNQLTGRLHEGNFLDIPARLSELDLSSNNFWGKLPSLSNSSSLEVLALSNNSFVGSLHNLVCSNSMNMTEVLDLSDNHLSGHIPKCWEKWPVLYYLSLQNNNLSGQFSKTLGSITSLNTLNKRNLTKSLWRLPPNLAYLDMSQNKFQGPLTFLDIYESLEVINLSSNEFWGPLHQLLCSNGTKGTQALNLGNNHFTGVIPECWEKWPNLKLLNLQNNNLSGEIPRTMGSLSSLELLNMHGNKISGKLPSSLMNLSNLKILQLGRNELVGSIPPWIGIKLTLLRILNLRSNNLFGNIPHQICYLSHAQILDLAHNNLSGNIPRCFNNFSVLSGIETNLDVHYFFSFSVGSYIASDSLVMKGREDIYRVFLGLVMLFDLSSNNFSGQVPNELTTLRELKSLNLSRNQLKGNIPDKIGDMKALESFDLSLNKLSGELPVSLAKLNYISNFNVSYNNLTGRIPTSTQIQSLNESSFFGNKLCGAPLTNGCVPVEVPNKIEDPKEDHESSETEWGFIISIVLGFITGFWVIVASLIVNKSWRITYFRLLSKLTNVFGL